MSRFVYQGVLQDGNGKRLESGNVAALLAGTSTPADIYTAATGGAAVASVTTASDGSWSFYVDEDDYAGTQRFDVVMSKSGYGSDTIEDIAVLPPSSHVGLSVLDTTDRTKISTLSAAGITTANTRVHTLPDFDAGVVGADHGGTITKIIKFLVSGATALKTMTLLSSHTDDRTLTLPDATGTLVHSVGGTAAVNISGNAATATKVGVLNVKVVDIGNWNMDTTQSFPVAHGLTKGKIRAISVTIRNDADDDSSIFPYVFDVAGTPYVAAYISAINTTNVGLVRSVGGIFDSADWGSSAPGGNRGWITIWYID